MDEDSDVTISDNAANRWGGGLFGGITPAVYDINLVPFAIRYVAGRISILNATFSSNTCLAACSNSPLFPSELAFVRFLSEFNCISLKNTEVVGRNDEVALYLLESKTNLLENCSFFGFGANVVEEDFE